MDDKIITLPTGQQVWLSTVTKWGHARGVAAGMRVETPSVVAREKEKRERRRVSRRRLIAKKKKEFWDSCWWLKRLPRIDVLGQEAAHAAGYRGDWPADFAGQLRAMRPVHPDEMEGE